MMSEWYTRISVVVAWVLGMGVGNTISKDNFFLASVFSVATMILLWVLLDTIFFKKGEMNDR